jgi:S1-C subfamily serine protease
LITLGTVRRPSLGIVSLPIGPELAQELGLPADYGILIVRVVQGGAADRAGLHGGSERAYLGATPIMVGGDLIVAIDKDPIGDQQDLANVMNKHRAGDNVTVTIYRGRKKMTVQAVLGEARDRA